MGRLIFWILLDDGAIGPPESQVNGVGHASELGSVVQVDKSETATKFTAYYSSCESPSYSSSRR